MNKNKEFTTCSSLIWTTQSILCERIWYITCSLHVSILIVLEIVNSWPVLYINRLYIVAWQTTAPETRPDIAKVTIGIG